MFPFPKIMPWSQLQRKVEAVATVLKKKERTHEAKMHMTSVCQRGWGGGRGGVGRGAGAETKLWSCYHIYVYMHRSMPRRALLKF